MIKHAGVIILEELRNGSRQAVFISSFSASMLGYDILRIWIFKRAKMASKILILLSEWRKSL